MRGVTTNEISLLESLGNSSSDWSKVEVNCDFVPNALRGNRFDGVVRIGKDVQIYNSSITNYSIGDRVVIRNVSSMVCNGSTFGNGVSVKAVNECGGRAVRIFDTLTAQIAYVVAMYRHHTKTIMVIEEMIDEYVATKRAEIGEIGADSTIDSVRFVRNVRIGSGCKIEGASWLENGTLLDDVRVGVDVKARDFIAVEGATIDMGATLHRCFVGENTILSNNFTAENSLFFANCHLENGEASAIFAGPHTVSHHKSSLLIAGMFSFFNAGSGTNQSNHLFKNGAIHQSIHRRGCRFASNGYVMSPADEGVYTTILGRHTHHHNTRHLPFSYLIEDKGVSMLMPALALRSCGTSRDIHKWRERDARSRRGAEGRDMINYEEFNPYVTGEVVKGLRILQSLQSTATDCAIYHYNGTSIKASMLSLGIKLYEKYIDSALGAMLSTSCADCGDVCSWITDWADVAGQYVRQGRIEQMLSDVETGKMNLTAIKAFFSGEAQSYDKAARSWAMAMLAELIGHRPTAEDVAECIARGKRAAEEFAQMAEADGERELSAEMSVGYGIDTDDEAEIMVDFRAVHRLI